MGKGGGDPNKIHDDGVEIPETAHQISTDSWFQVAFVLTTGVNSAYVLGYSGTIMVPLGWVGGVVGLVLAAAISLYANALIAMLHEYGGTRHIRYRDLAGYIYGKKAYSITWTLQYINLFMINTGYIILAGSALKAAYTVFRDDGVLKLPYCIAIAGIVCAMFAICIPHLSALGVWLGVSTVFTFVYIVIALVLSIKDGMNSPARDYAVPEHGVTKIFTTIGASASLVFAYNTGMLPEIQATIKQPVVKNMMKSLWFQFTIGLVPMYMVTFGCKVHKRAAMEKIRYNSGAADMRNTSTKEKQKTTKNSNKASDIEAEIYIYNEAYHHLKSEDIPIKNLAAKTP